EAMAAETVNIRGHEDDLIDAYLARPTGPGPHPGVVVIHHMPGWDEATKEIARKFAHHGYIAISPNLHFREGKGTPEENSASIRTAGGMPDERTMGDVEGAMAYLRTLPYLNGKVGIIGYCSGGRQVYLAACTLRGIDAAVDCWGGSVIVDDASQLTPARPKAPIELTEGISAPLMGIFGNDDTNPDIDQVNRTEERLKALGKTYEFHRYDGAGHGFFANSRPGYRAEQAMDAWQKVFRF